MIVSIHQPGYIPWHGFFHRLALSDIHVFFDTSQFEKNGFNNRVKIRNAQGEQWLTVPIQAKGRFGNNRIAEAEISQTVDWRRVHLRTLALSYGKSRFYSSLAPFLESLYSVPWVALGPLNIFAIEHLAGLLGIGCRFVRASELAVSGVKSDLVLNLCRAVGATTYISGVNGRDYLEKSAFAAVGISLRFQAYREPRYPQLHGGFRQYMSVIDLIANCGPDAYPLMMAGQDSIDTGSVFE